MMKTPTYEKIFESTIRRLDNLRALGEKKSNPLNRVDIFLFFIVGNINLRLKTIFFLLENGITDGVLPLQRTVYELQLAFQVYSSATAEEKERFIRIYLNKKGFESAVKWDKLLTGKDSILFTDIDRDMVSSFKQEFKKKIEVDSDKKLSVFKLWYEIASGKSFKELSDEMYSGVEFFSSYDELSNWLHPQRLQENLNPENFEQQLPDEYWKMLINVSIWSVNSLAEDMVFMAKHFNLDSSPRFFKYGDNVFEFTKKLNEIRDNI
ncbi:DUF5677 domain-containing protein [Enterococcus sp. LJL51]|uniref:DUF5677 domain-containing protein n=1 Tax=Enterococcus sp. LJL51 TaxID=3416656 RepID=UPI003CF472A3